MNRKHLIQEVKDTRDGCRSLAERATYFAWGVYDQLKHCDVDTQSISTKEHVQLLLWSVHSVLVQCSS